MKEPTFNDRLLLFLSVFMFGLGILNTARGDTGFAYLDFATSGLCLATYR